MGGEQVAQGKGESVLQAAAHQVSLELTLDMVGQSSTLRRAVREVVVYRVIVAHLVKKAGHTHVTARTGAVTLIQCFGSALNLNIHYHMLFLDGVYVVCPDGSARFRWIKAPSNQELTQLAHTIAHRVGRFLNARVYRNGIPRTAIWLWR